MNTHILKFGGTSVASPENILPIIEERLRTHRVVVVVSAPAGVTSALDAEAGRRGIERNSAEHDAILGEGERLAAPFVAELLRSRGINAVAVDATEVVRTDATFGGARVDLDVTRLLLSQKLAALGDAVPVIPGYVGATHDGLPTTLGRGGSDITAAVVGAALDADEVEIWSDVDGIFSADPRSARNARLLQRLTHADALRLARNGAKVLHPETIPPLAQRGIRLSVRNTFAPERSGTEIGTRPPVELVIAGATGKVGSALVRLLEEVRPEGVRLHVRGNTSTYWPEALAALHPPTLFVDCTASPFIASLYETLLERGVGIVTANKIAGAGPQWHTLRRLARRRALPLRYETTVGAALPVLRTARELVATGDRLLALDAILSGTLSYILARVQEEVTFEEAVAEAHVQGLTEPDPRVDLSGRDVAAKLVILLR
ncbi:MAG: hypothetical protein ACLGH0_05295, partial [Thermoanaerobaculia bacterium]